MQTFLPLSSFTDSARVLDRQRLGKQRVEAKQIMLALSDPSYGWQNHPAVKMWRGHDYALACYGYRVCKEWISRGYNDSLLEFFVEHIKRLKTGSYPEFMDNRDFHLSHQSNLLRKDPVWYSRFGWTVGPDLEYIWPDPS